jgi:hypothetical protein
MTINFPLKLTSRVGNITFSTPIVWAVTNHIQNFIHLYH